MEWDSFQKFNRNYDPLKIIIRRQKYEYNPQKWQRAAFIPPSIVWRQVKKDHIERPWQALTNDCRSTISKIYSQIFSHKSIPIIFISSLSFFLTVWFLPLPFSCLRPLRSEGALQRSQHVQLELPQREESQKVLERNQSQTPKSALTYCVAKIKHPQREGH